MLQLIWGLFPYNFIHNWKEDIELAMHKTETLGVSGILAMSQTSELTVVILTVCIPEVSRLYDVIASF